MQQQLPLAKSNPVPEKPNEWITRKHVPPNEIVDSIGIKELLRHRCVTATRRRRNRVGYEQFDGFEVVVDGGRVRDEE